MCGPGVARRELAADSRPTALVAHAGGVAM
jgi:hypothetical protein